jgi:hypothetical protein
VKPVFAASREMLQRKPAHGAPCNRCGLCCVATKCALGQALFGGVTGPCPALKQMTPREWSCGVVALTGHFTAMDSNDPEWREMQRAAALLIRAGEGCDARFNGEPVSLDFHRESAKLDAARHGEIAAAKNIWGVP